MTHCNSSIRCVDSSGRVGGSAASGPQQSSRPRRSIPAPRAARCQQAPLRGPITQSHEATGGDQTMTRLERELLEREPGWSDVLAAYADDARRLHADGGSGANACGRVDHVEGVDPTRLSRIHGKLIALGLLQFRLVDRHVGLQYEITPRGWELLQMACR